MNELYDNDRDHSPARSPVVVFLMVWVSFGFYGIVWLFQSARLLNSYGPHKPYDLKILRLPIVLFLVIFAICLVAYVFTDSPDPGGSESLDLRIIVVQVTAVIAYLLALYAMWHVSRATREAEVSRGLDRPIVPAGSIVGSFLGWTCIAYIQHHLNRLDT
jgi:hypothetical protein